MRLVVGASLAALACAAVLPALAQSEEKGVPIFQAPFHVPAMKNEYGTVLIINVPPGRNTGYHIHDAELVLGQHRSRRHDEPESRLVAGQPAEPRPGRPHPLHALFQGRRAHASGEQCRQFAFPQCLVPLLVAAARTASRRRRAVQGYEQIADNERFRAWRLALQPGQSAAPYKQGAPGMRVIVSGGELTETVPGQLDRGMKPRDGQFFWQEAGTTRTVKNTGTTPLNIVEIELK